MKYILVISSIILAVFLLLNTVDSYAEEGARVIYLKGTVKVQRADTDFWILAQKNMILQDKDKIATSAISAAEIALDQTLKNIVRLEANTEVTLQELRARKLFMSKGKVFSVMESLPQDSSFQVRTPTAVAGVTGSGMSVATTDKDTTVSCFEDKAYVQGIDVDGELMVEVLIVEEGSKRLVGRFEMPSDLIALTMLERDEWTQFRQNLREHLDWLREQRAQGSRSAALVMDEISRIQERFEEDAEDNKENIFEEDEHDRRDRATGASSSEDSHRYVTP